MVVERLVGEQVVVGQLVGEELVVEVESSGCRVIGWGSK